MSLTLRVLKNDLPTLPAAMRARVHQACRKTAADIQADWAAGVRVRTGNLKNSILGGANHISTETDTSVTVGTSVAYAVYENYGTRRMAGSFAREKAVEKNRRAHAAAVAQAVRG